MATGGAPTAHVPGLAPGDVERDAAGRRQVGFGRVALGERLGQGEGLEGRSRLAARPTTLPAHGQVQLGEVEVAAAHHRPHPAVGADGDDRAVGARLGEVVDDRLVRLLLPVHVERRVDAQPALVDPVLAEPVDQVLADGLVEVLGAELVTPHPGEEVGLGPGQDEAGAALDEVPRGVSADPEQADLPLDLRRPVVLLFGDAAELEHVVERGVAPADGLARVAGGVGRLRGPDQAGQVGGLHEGQVLDVGEEVGLRRRLHAVGAPPEVDGVQVALEDLGLRELALQLDGVDGLPDLAGQGPLPGQVDELHVLLGDGRPTLGGLGGAPDLGPPGPGDAGGVDTVVPPEVLVLGGDHGVDEDLGDAPVGDDDPVLLATQPGGGVVLVAVAGDLTGADEGGLAEALGLRGELDVGQDHRRAGHPGHQDEHRQEEDAAPAPEEASGDGSGDGGSGPRGRSARRRRQRWSRCPKACRRKARGSGPAPEVTVR